MEAMGLFAMSKFASAGFKTALFEGSIKLGGQCNLYLSKEIHNYSYPKRKRYIEETQEIEFEMRWTKEMYDKIDIYRKSDFREDNYPIHYTFDYYTKE